ncbi:unnamed protein product [Haemonchus placei]|uniref:Uncharacterized protein n=1 Tax=Haemonchus placei TaxID=6290 RepID=A0A3P7UM36_HAEPC|nr:unnamed protein product [Haemonchus placei]
MAQYGITLGLRYPSTIHFQKITSATVSALLSASRNSTREESQASKSHYLEIKIPYRICLEW